MHALVEELIVKLPDIEAYAAAKAKRGREDEQERPYNPTARVSRAAHDLEFEQFRNPDGRERLNEIRALAREQVLDDNPRVESEVYWNKQRSRAGKVGSTGEFYQEYQGLWPERDTNQRALELGMAPFLEQLSGEQRVLVRFRYGAQMSLGDIGRQLGTSRQAVDQRMKVIHKQLQAAMLAAFPGEEVQDGCSDS